MSRLPVVDRWNRFWFAPRSTAPLAIVRIAFGLVVTCWVATVFPVLDPFFGDTPAVVRQTLPAGGWTLLEPGPGRFWTVVLLWAVSLLGAVALTVGYRTRIAAVVVFVGLVSFTRQMPVALNSGDFLLRVISFYFVLAPAGAALSVDRWRAEPERFWDCPRRPAWTVRLLQVQLSVIYLSSVWEKLAGVTWRNGTALSYAMRIADLQLLPVPAFVTDQLWLIQALTLGTLALEAALATLVWNRAARPWVLAGGVALHVGINLVIAIGFFSVAMFVLYLAFLTPVFAERLVAGVRSRVGRTEPPATAVGDAPGEPQVGRRPDDQGVGSSKAVSSDRLTPTGP